MTEPATTDGTYFQPLSGLDAVNYIVIASKIKIAVHEDVLVEHLHFVDGLRDIIAIHKQSSHSEVAEDGSIRRFTTRDVIERMDNLLKRLDAAELRLCFRMWSMATVNELVRMALDEAEAVDSEDLDEEAQRPQNDGYGAVIAFLIVPQSLPVMIPESGNSHCEICVTQVPDWDALQDELEEV